MIEQQNDIQQRLHKRLIELAERLGHDSKSSVELATSTLQDLQQAIDGISIKSTVRDRTHIGPIGISEPDSLRLISEYVAPWALSGEKIPIQFVWEPEEHLYEIIVSLPTDMQIDEILNVGNYSVNGSRIAISKDSLKSPNYFGLVLKSTKVEEELLVRKTIEVDFRTSNRTIMSRRLEARIVRPGLKIRQAPSKIVISDASNPKDLIRLSVVHMGLGRAKIDVKVLTSGSLISQSHSLYLEICRELLEELSKGFTTESPSVPEDIQVDQKWIDETTHEILENIEKGVLPSDFDEHAVQELLEALKDDQRRQTIIQAIYTRVRQLAIASVLHYLDRYPQEDIDLPKGNIVTLLKSELNSLTIRFEYSDSIGNVLPAEERSIVVEDMRTSREKMFQAPINISWITEPFKVE